VIKSKTKSVSLEEKTRKISVQFLTTTHPSGSTPYCRKCGIEIDLGVLIPNMNKISLSLFAFIGLLLSVHVALTVAAVKQSATCFFDETTKTYKIQQGNFRQFLQKIQLFFL
jgi:hypothetical protein